MILCQKCGSINQVGEEICGKCGTKLMIISYSDHQNSSLPAWEEHLLERISALEYSVGRLDERLSEIHNLVHQLATEGFYDHAMIESIADALKRVQIVGKRELEHDWQRKITQRLLESEKREKFEASKKDFLNAFRGSNKELFVNLIDEGSQLFMKRNYRSGLKCLEKAFSVDPQNCEVGIFLSKMYYELENFASAAKCLHRVLKTNPHHFEANLLTGLLAKRRGDFSKARQFLSNAADICQTSLSAHVFLGSVLVSLGDDGQAMSHFSRALNLKPSPQMYLLVGSIYSRQGRLRHAIKHIKKAIEMDPCCHEAFFQLGLAFWGQNWRNKARECFQTAIHLNPKDFRYKNTLDLFTKGARKTAPHVDLPFTEALSEERLEVLIKDELQISFRRQEVAVGFHGDGSKSK